MSRQTKIKKGFNFLSSFYDFGSAIFFGNKIFRSQTYFIPQLQKCKSVLIFGGGTGKILIELLKRDIAEQYCYVDISENMISKTQERVLKFFPDKTGKIKFIYGTYTEISTEENFDLIITPYVLDCFSKKELPEVMQALHKKLSQEGKWLFADFNIPASGIMCVPAKTIIRILYFFFNISCGLGIKQLPDFKKHFTNLGYSTSDEQFFLKGILTAKIYSRQ